MTNGFEDIPILENEETWSSRVIDEQDKINAANNQSIPLAKELTQQ
jgi:hypothetical protein